MSGPCSGEGAAGKGVVDGGTEGRFANVPDTVLGSSHRIGLAEAAIGGVDKKTRPGVFSESPGSGWERELVISKPAVFGRRVFKAPGKGRSYERPKPGRERESLVPYPAASPSAGWSTWRLIPPSSEIPRLALAVCAATERS